MPDTWGIPGPTFLVYYIGAIVVVAVVAAIHRRTLFRGHRDAHVDTLGPQQIAYLNGGGRLAIYSSMGGLRATGAIDSGSFKTLQQSGPIPGGVTPLDNAIYNAAGRRVPARAVADDQWVKAALSQLREGLEAAGLAITPGQLRAARRWVLAGLALILIGVARLIDGAAHGKPVTFLVFAIGLAVILTVRLRAPKRFATDATITAMSTLRTRNEHLSPRQSPAYATYGAAGAAMGVALFGAASLYSMDPAFAAEAEISRLSGVTGLSGSGSGSSFTSDSSSSCGGSTSSCGGSSSSCGGGGGGCGG